MTKGRPTPGAGDPGAAGDRAHRSTRRSITLSPGHSSYAHKPYRDGLGPTIFTWLFSAEDQTSDARGASMGCEFRCAPVLHRRVLHLPVLLAFEKTSSPPLKLRPHLSPHLTAGTRSAFIEKCNIEVHHVIFSACSCDGNWV